MTARPHTPGTGRGVCAWLRDSRGGAAVEFGILAPVLALVLAGLIDLGSVVYTKFKVDNAVSAGANYALVQSASVDSAGSEKLAAAIAVIVTNGNGSTATSVVVNNGPKVTLKNGKAETSGSAAAADSCYCPTVGDAGVAWGAAAKCGTACAGGGQAGKFVEIAASLPYTALFSNYTIVNASAITTRTVVQTE